MSSRGWLVNVRYGSEATASVALRRISKSCALRELVPAVLPVCHRTVPLHRRTALFRASVCERGLGSIMPERTKKFEKTRNAAATIRTSISEVGDFSP